MTSDEREAHVNRYFPLLRIIARRVARICQMNDLDDLLGDGAIGLLHAIDTFDPARGTSLERFARSSILGAMLNGLRRWDPVPERARRIIRKAERVRDALSATGPAPNTRQIEMIVPRYRLALTALRRNVPLSLELAAERGMDMPIDWSGDPARTAAARERRMEIGAALTLLSERQRRIVYEHYFDDRSLREISERMRVSPQRISQLHLSALNRLRGSVAVETLT